MAARTTTQAGDFAADATWGGTKPTNGDTITVNHAVTWAPAAGSTFALGTGTGTAITIGTSGTLTITGAGAFTLNLTGGIDDQNTTTQGIVVNATNGAVAINVDATADTAGFQLLTGNAYDGFGANVTNLRGLKLNGNATYRITLTSLPSNGTKNSYFPVTTRSGGGVVNASYTDFVRIGDGTNSAFAPNFINTRSFPMAFDNCTFTSCGQFLLSPDDGYASAISFTDCTWITPVTDQATTYPLNMNSQVTGSVTFTRCIWPVQIKFSTVTGVTWTNCYFHNAWAGTHTATAWNDMNGCFVRQTFDSAITPGPVTNCFLYWDNPSGVNPHWLTNSTSYTGGTIAWSGNVAYFNGSDANGNIFTVSGSGITPTYNIVNNLALPNAAGAASGVLVTSASTVSNGFAINVNHNTAFVKDQYGLEIGHYYTTVETPSRFPSVKSNLFIGGTTGYKVDNPDNTTTQDLISPTAADYNGSYQIKLTSGASNNLNEGRGYAARWSATPGTHDVDGQNPNFVNGSASLANWAISQGSTNTGVTAEADAITYIKAALGTKMTALKSYFAAAYAPTNTAYHGTAHDGTDIGAFAWTSSGTYGPFLNFICGD